MNRKSKPGRPNPGGSAVRREMLLSTRVAGVRHREAWYARLAANSLAQGWTPAEIKAAVRSDVATAAATGRLGNITTITSEGILAASAPVRGELERLTVIRDQVWEQDKELVRRAVQSPAHALIELMRRQRRANERHHAASAPAFIAYLKGLAGRSRRKRRASGGASSSSVPQPAQITIGARTPRIPLTYQADQATLDALLRKSHTTRKPIQRLLDTAVRSWLQGNP